MNTYTYSVIFNRDEEGVTIKFPMFDMEIYEETDDEMLAAKEILTLEIVNCLDANKSLPNNEVGIVTENDEVVDITVTEEDIALVVRE